MEHTTTLALERIAAEIIGASLPVYVLRISNICTSCRERSQLLKESFQTPSNFCYSRRASTKIATQMRDFDVEALASAYQRSGRMEDAISYYQELIGPKGKVVSWEPQLRWLTAHYTLAGIYLSRGEREKARKTFSLSSFDARDSRKFYVNWSGDCGDSVASSVLANQHLACFQCRQAVQLLHQPIQLSIQALISIN